MEIFIPFMLFFLDWKDGAPELTRHPAVYQDEQACRAAGSTILPDRGEDAGDARFWCIAMPDREEFARLMQDIETQHVARRDMRDAEGSPTELRPTP